MSFRLIRLYDIKNEQRDISWTLSILDVGTVSQTVRSGNGSYIKRNHARPALLTVFSITQSDHSITLLSIHDITDLRNSEQNWDLILKPCVCRDYFVIGEDCSSAFWGEGASDFFVSFFSLT